MNNFNLFDRYFIIDNFYADPYFVRNLALTQDKEEQSQGNYAGIMTNSVFFTKEHTEVFSYIVGHPIKPSTSFNGKFRFSKKDDTYNQDIHFDPGENNCAWAGVCYLTPDHEEDGTYFWKHLRTGLEEIPRSLQGLNEHGWKGVDDLKVFLDTEGVDHSLWKKTLTIPYRFNRLVLFRPWMFHSPGSAFGDTLENSRLIQTFFLSPA